MWDAIHNWANPLKHITQHKQHKINHKCSHSRNDHPGLTADGYLFKSIKHAELTDCMHKENHMIKQLHFHQFNVHMSISTLTMSCNNHQHNDM